MARADTIHSAQILLHQSTWNQLLSMHTEEMENQDAILFTNMGQHRLKGISKMVYIIQAVPAALSSRSFPQIKTKTTKLYTPSTVSVSAGQMDIETYLAECGGISLKEAETRTQVDEYRDAEGTGPPKRSRYDLKFLGMGKPSTRLSLHFSRYIMNNICFRIPITISLGADQ